MFKIKNFLIYLLFGLGIFYWVYQRTNNHLNVQIDISQIKLLPFLLVFMLIFVSIFLRTLRMGTLYTTPSKDTLKKLWILYSSIPLSIIIGGGGVFLRILLLKQRLKISYLVSLTNTMLEKLFDLTFIFLAIILTTYSIPTLKERFYNQLEIIPYVTTLAIVIIILVAFKRVVINILFIILNKIRSHKWRWRFKKKAIVFFHTSKSFQQYNKILVFLLYSLIIWLTEITMIYTFFISMGIPLSFFEAFFINTINLLFLLLPLSPSGIGIIQAAFIFSGSLLDLPHNMLSYSIIFHLTLLLANLIFLMLGLYKIELNLGQIKNLIKKN